ncbi:hypothetical protein [Parachlamydia sp. AcF125]|uniref:hypothetical protein n=1 Tax=Parachlamydia sp. AcF125 TaxID=2795736 RepID=UPI001BC8F0CA|nr:hypothetical protein [Parachlamydia sp. AcF125]MBS4168603.1 hypothetical protein [Parachlamydia sp. AcF125]
MKRLDASQIKKELAKNHACYVLITCDPPSADGNMQVCMSYEGDTALAAYLLKGAQSFIEEQDEEIEGVGANLKIIE